MGRRIVAGRTAEGEPFLLIGAPGETVGTYKQAGGFHYVRQGRSIAINQDTPGVDGGPESGDRFGDALAADGRHFAVSGPGEDVSGQTDAGTVAVFDHHLTTGNLPTFLQGIDTEEDDVSGGPEVGDGFGTSLAMTTYRPASAPNTIESLLMVGAPGESMPRNGTNLPNAGRVAALRITDSGAYIEMPQYWQGSAEDSLADAADEGDRFGETVTIVNTAPRSVATTATLRLAVGVPGEDSNAGTIHTFSPLGSPGADDVTISAGGASGLPGPAVAGKYVGRNIHLTSTALYVGLPHDGTTGSAHVLPWPSISGGTAQAVTSYRPGTGVLPAAGTDFGRVMR